MKGTVQQVMDRANKIMKNDRSTYVALTKEIKSTHKKRLDSLSHDRKKNKNMNVGASITNPFTKETVTLTSKNKNLIKSHDKVYPDKDYFTHHVMEKILFDKSKNLKNPLYSRTPIFSHKPVTSPRPTKFEEVGTFPTHTRFQENEASMYNRLMHKVTGQPLYEMNSPFVRKFINVDSKIMRPSAENAVRLRDSSVISPFGGRKVKGGIGLTRSLGRGDLSKFDAKEIESILKHKGLRTGYLKPQDAKAIRFDKDTKQ